MQTPDTNSMETLGEKLAWTGVALPDALCGINDEQQAALADYAKAVADARSEGFDELFHAIGSIVRYIPHFIVIPLMVEHIRPRIAAGVCKTMTIEQACHYANDLPTEYFADVSRHIDNGTMADILETMKRNQAEKVIAYELRHDPMHMLGIAENLGHRLLEVIAKHVTLPEKGQETLAHPHEAVIEKLRALQSR